MDWFGPESMDVCDAHLSTHEKRFALTVQFFHPFFYFFLPVPRDFGRMFYVL